MVIDSTANLDPTDEKQLRIENIYPPPTKHRRIVKVAQPPVSPAILSPTNRGNDAHAPTIVVSSPPLEDAPLDENSNTAKKDLFSSSLERRRKDREAKLRERRVNGPRQSLENESWNPMSKIWFSVFSHPNHKRSGYFVDSDVDEPDEKRLRRDDDYDDDALATDDAAESSARYYYVAGTVVALVAVSVAFALARRKM